MLPFARVEHGLPLRQRIAAHAGAAPYVTHGAINIILQQSVTSNWLDTVYSLLMKSQHSSDVLKIVFLIEKT